MWWTRKKIGSDEYEQLSNKITALRADIGEAQQEVRGLRTDVNLLRGQFNRKLSGLAKEEEKVEPKEEEEAPKAKPLNTKEAVVFTGMPYGIIPK
jgi:predicted  nucleic acid-binding Zn-ribbon protein